MTSPASDLPPQHPMAEEDRPHKPADDTEEIYYQGSPMLRGELGRLFGFGIAGLILIAIPILYAVFSRDHTWPHWLVTLICIGLGLILWFVPLIMTKTIRYRISNYRIDFERGLFSKSIDTLELWHVEDIAFHQSFIDRILNVGTIVVISHDETTPRLPLKSVPNARQTFDQLKQRIISVKRQRGVVKMDVG